MPKNPQPHAVNRRHIRPVPGAGKNETATYEDRLIHIVAESKERRDQLSKKIDSINRDLAEAARIQKQWDFGLIDMKAYKFGMKQFNIPFLQDDCDWMEYDKSWQIGRILDAEYALGEIESARQYEAFLNAQAPKFDFDGSIILRPVSIDHYV